MSDGKNYMENLPSNKQEEELKALKQVAHDKLREAQQAWHQYWTACEVGQDRIRGAEVYDNLMRATRS